MQTLWQGMSRLKHIIIFVTIEFFSSIFHCFSSRNSCLRAVYSSTFQSFFSYNFVFVLVLNMHHYFFLLTIILGMIRSSSWIKYNSLQIVCSFFAIGKSYPGNCIIGEVTDSWTCHIIMHRILCHVIKERLILCS